MHGQELLSKNKVFTVDITTELCPEDGQSQKNTYKFINKVLEMASNSFKMSVAAKLAVSIPAIVS